MSHPSSGHAADLLLSLPIVVPALTAAGYALPGRRTGPAGRTVTGWAGMLSPAAILAGAIALAATTPGHGPVRAWGRLLRADALTVWMLLVVGAVAALAVAAGPAYLAGERAAGGAADNAARRYCLLVHAFLAAMSLAVLAENLGVLWVAVEATTIVTAFLVGHRRTRASIEAAWKYVVICSVGIALAFLGTVLIYYAARQAGLSEAAALDWPALVAHARQLDPDTTRLGFGLIVLGFGAKAGLVPLHAWLPDAHSQAPAPVSALMSGVLLSVSFTAVLRYKVIADDALGTGFARLLLTGTALLTLALAAGLLLGQRDYKRMLAYSSMEHMSLIALGAAVGSPLAIAAVLLHIAGHGLAKTVAFCSAGEILRLRRTTRIGRLRGLLAQAPALGAAFGLAVIALLGLPPFSLFASEVGIARAGFAAGLGAPLAAALLLALAAFAALTLRTARLLLGPPPDDPGAPGAPGAPVAPGAGPGSVPVRIGAAAGGPLLTGLLACAALGTATGPLTGLLHTASAIIGGR
ncbi:proton-conducting transporter transmembrane domain-containing protein [Streptacidiphilus cavernicola]|uniref:Proton-conducting transporter membrane subunit n=1 Tax=Streptacidiphilus cavernicola TaxID=3342716 RepID=A0ABV6VWJ0_9ACTN